MTDFDRGFTKKIFSGKDLTASFQLQTPPLTRSPKGPLRTEHSHIIQRLVSVSRLYVISSPARSLIQKLKRL